MASTRNLARDVILQRCYFYLCASSILCCAFFRSLSRLLFFLLNVIIVSDHRNIFSEKTSNQYVSRYILNIHSTNISNKRKRKSGYLSLFSFLSPSPVAMVIDNIRCAVSSFVHILCFLLSFWEKPEQEERERGNERKKPILVHLDIVKKIVRLPFFLRTISAEETYTLGSFLLSKSLF